jgi:hypothetical protein
MIHYVKLFIPIILVYVCFVIEEIRGIRRVIIFLTGNKDPF